MAIAGTRLMCGPPPLLGQNHSPIATTALRSLPLQVKKEEGQKSQALKSFSVSRRDTMMFLAAQALSAATFWSIEPAEARVSRSEIKKKILEKLEQLREKAGISKPKDDNEKTPSPQPPPPPPPRKDESLQSLQASPNFLKGPVGALVEVIIP